MRRRIGVGARYSPDEMAVAFNWGHELTSRFDSMDEDEPLRQLPTHSADESEGSVMGVSIASMKWVVLALIAGVLPGFLLIVPLGLLWGAVIIFGPPVAVAAFQILFLQDKPPGWFFQWLETRLLGGHLSPLLHR